MATSLIKNSTYLYIQSLQTMKSMSLKWSLDSFHTALQFRSQILVLVHIGMTFAHMQPSLSIFIEFSLVGGNHTKRLFSSFMICDTLLFQLHGFQGLSRDSNMIFFPHKKTVCVKWSKRPKFTDECWGLSNAEEILFRELKTFVFWTTISLILSEHSFLK